MRTTTRFAINVFQNDQDPFDELLISAMLDAVDAAMVGKIQDVTLGSTQATIDFQNIPQGFGHLLLVAHLRDTGAGTQLAGALRFNNDSGANYDFEMFSASATSPASFEQFAQTSLRPGDYPGSTAPAGVFSAMRILIPRYANAAYNKGCESSCGMKGGITTGLIRAQAVAGFWRSNAAINRLTLISTGTLFDVGSEATLYGMP